MRPYAQRSFAHWSPSSASSPPEEEEEDDDDVASDDESSDEFSSDDRKSAVYARMTSSPGLHRSTPHACITVRR